MATRATLPISIFLANAPSSYARGVESRIEFAAKLSSGQFTPTSEFSDFKVVCSGKEYPVHRIIIASHSEYFKRLCKSDFREAESREVVLRDDPDAAVLAMIQYMYCFDYSQSELGCPENALRLHSWVFTIADKYDVPGLKALAFEKFSSVSFVYRTAGFSIGPSSEIRAAQLLEVVSHTYSNAPPSDDRLKVLVVERFMMEDKKLLRACKKDAFNKVLFEVPEFACDLIPALSGFEMGKSDADADQQE